MLAEIAGSRKVQNICYEALHEVKLLVWALPRKKECDPGVDLHPQGCRMASKHSRGHQYSGNMRCRQTPAHHLQHFDFLLLEALTAVELSSLLGPILSVPDKLGHRRSCSHQLYGGRHCTEKPSLASQPLPIQTGDCRSCQACLLGRVSGSALEVAGKAATGGAH